ncbi:AI-2E family transporter [Jatrophihabitans sp.]|uniref:AI-2E family transporter n=1 Tax=Jatrophihabitans sp. TaxID=1932789 RepID=UPI002CC130E0|nr:AI-2E family transporter [Jatrophihabitans sp.]
MTESALPSTAEPAPPGAGPVPPSPAEPALPPAEPDQAAAEPVPSGAGLVLPSASGPASAWGAVPPAAEQSLQQQLTGRPRRGFATYSPFRLGLTAAIGFGLAYLLFRALEHGKDTLVLLGLSLFLAAGLDPAVRRIEAAGLKRGPSVAIVFVGTLVFLTGMCLAVVPPLVDQTATFLHHLPGYVTDLQHNRRVAELDRRFGLLDSVQHRLEGSAVIQQVAGNLLSVGSTVASTIFEVFTVAILTLYFLAYLRDITAFAYRLTPASRRPRVSRIGDKIVAQIGAYVVGTVTLALVRGAVTAVFLWIVGVPYPFALAFIAAVLDLAPVLGTALGALVVSTVVLLESVPTGIGVIGFFIAYEAVARMLLLPRVLDRSVRISPAGALVGALVGYTVLGVIGFLISIPLVAVLTLIMREVVLPRQASR